MRRISLFCALCFLAVRPSTPLLAQDAPSPTPEELVERERVRPAVEGALSDLRDPADPSEPLVEQQRRIAFSLASLGPPVIPFLAAEVDLPDRFTFVPSIWALGLVKTPEAVEAIRKALSVADREGGGFGRFRKIWSVYALALAGDTRAIQASAEGETPVDWAEFMEDMRLLDVVAGLLVPESRVILMERIRALRTTPAGETGAEEERVQRLVHAVRSLGWVGDSSSLETLASLLSHPDSRIQVEATVSLGRIGGPGAVPALMQALASGTVVARVEAARALYAIGPMDRTKEIVARLESENDTSVRRWLYRIVASQVQGEAAIEIFRSHRNRPDPIDRGFLADAVGESGNRSGLNLLRVMLRDPFSDVALNACVSIHRVGGEGALDTLLALIEDPRPAVSQVAVELLAESGESRAAPRIAEVLLRMTAFPRSDPGMRAQIQIRAEALVRLRYSPVIEDLRRHAGLQTDPADRDILADAADRLALLAELGDDREGWVRAAASEDASVRALAYERLPELGGKKSVDALLEALKRASVPEEAVILMALAETGSSDSEEIFRQRLDDPAWDAPARRDARAAAAWGARRLATPAMIDALERSALRREGEDFLTLVYLAVAAPERAAGTIRRLLPLRLRRYDWPVGREQSELVAILGRLESGRRAMDRDVPPSRLDLH